MAEHRDRTAKQRNVAMNDKFYEWRDSEEVIYELNRLDVHMPARRNSCTFSDMNDLFAGD